MRLGGESPLTDMNLALTSISQHQILEEVLGGLPTRVLEVGAGSGKLSIHLALRGSIVTLVDIDPDMVNYQAHLVEALRHLHLAIGHEALPRDVTCLQGDARSLQLRDRSYDLAWSEGVVEHFTREDQVRILQEQARVSVGYVAFQVPDAANPENQRIAQEVHHHYEGMPEHEVPLTRDECLSIAKDAGLVDVKVYQVEPRFLFVIGRKPTMDGFLWI